MKSSGGAKVVKLAKAYELWHGRGVLLVNAEESKGFSYRLVP